jgi:hypothetical protein
MAEALNLFMSVVGEPRVCPERLASADPDPRTSTLCAGCAGVDTFRLGVAALSLAIDALQEFVQALTFLPTAKTTSVPTSD